MRRPYPSLLSCFRFKRPLLSQCIVALGITVVLLKAAPPPATAQSVDDGLWVTNAPVHAIVAVGALRYLGGDFTEIGPPTGSMVVLDPATGAALPPIHRLFGEVWAAADDGNGGFFLGGSFSTVQFTTRNNLAHIDASGNLTSWNPNANGTVNTIVVSGGTVYIGGLFTTVGGMTRNRVAALNAITGSVLAFNPNAGSTVSALLVDGGTVYLGGTFSTVGATTRTRLAAVDATTGALLAWDPNVTGSTVSCLGLLDSTVYVGGSFTQVSATPRNNLAAVHATTGALGAWDPNTAFDVQCMVATPAAIYVGGNLNKVGALFRSQIAAIDPATGIATAWNPSAIGQVKSIALDGGLVYAGGDFTSIGGQPRRRIAALDATTGLATLWAPNANELVRAIAVGGGRVFAGGDFSSVGGQLRSRLAAIDAAGDLAAWNPGANGTVYSLVSRDSTLYVGGSFTTIGGAARGRLAQLDVNTGAPTAWNPNLNSVVYEIEVAETIEEPRVRTVYAGGIFTTASGMTRNRIAAVDGSTGAPTAWNPDASSGVYEIELDSTPGGVVTRVFLGGDFATVGGQARARLAAVDGAGAVLPWNPGTSGSVRALALNVDRTLAYVGGGFTSAGGASRINIAAIDAASGAATSWNPGASSSVSVIVPHGSLLFVGGAFSTISGSTRARVAALNAATGAATSWSLDITGFYPRDQISSTVNTLSVDGGRVLGGGSFSRVASRSRSCLFETNVGLVAADPPAISGSHGRMTAAPNPFHGVAEIRLALPGVSAVPVTVCDVTGRRIRVLKSLAAGGVLRARWDGLDETGTETPAGVYIASVRIGARTLAVKLLRMSGDR